MGVRPSGEVNDQEGNGLAVDQIGAVYANVKTVSQNIAAIIDVSGSLGDIALIAANMGTITSAATSAADAAASAAEADADRIAAEAAKTAAQLAETNAVTAKNAAVAAQVAAEAARDQAQDIVGGDYATSAELTAGLAGKANLAGGNTISGVQNFTGNVNVSGDFSATGANKQFGPTAGAAADDNSFFDCTNYYHFWTFRRWAAGVPTTQAFFQVGDGFVKWQGAEHRFNTMAGDTSLLTVAPGGNTSHVAMLGPIEAYGAGWNGSAKFVTQDAIYDKIEALSAALTGGVMFQATWNAATNTPAIPAASAANKGHYYKVSVDGATSIDGITDWKVGDWIISNGTAWEKVDNTESVTMVAGKSGNVTLVKGDVGLGNVDNTSDANKPVSTAQQTALNGKASLTGGNAFTGDQTVTGNVISTKSISNECVIRGGASEGGQIILGYVGQTAITGGGNSTWNIDVAGSNELRIYRVSATGVSTVALQFDEPATTAIFNSSTVWLNNNKLLLQHDGSNGYIRTTVGSISVTAPLRYNQAGGHYWQPENGASTWMQLGLDSGIPRLTINGTITLITDNWSRSSDGKNRIFWAANGTSYWGSGNNVHEWRSGVDVTMMTLNNGNLTVTGDVTASSDRRLKNSIDYDFVYGLSDIVQLRPAHYRWNDEDKNGDLPDLGLIAQDVEEIFPELVATDDAGMKSVNYQKLSVVLLQAVKELSARVEALEAGL